MGVISLKKRTKYLISALSVLTLVFGIMPAQPVKHSANGAAKLVDPIKFSYNGFYFDKATGTITGYNGVEKNVEIPSEIDGIAVTAIGEKAFEDNEYITSVTIPEGVTSIGKYAFSECVELGKVSIPESVTSIGESAFANCL